MNLKERALIEAGTSLNRLFYRHVDGENRPVFFDIERDCPALQEVTRNHEVILEELEAILPRKNRIPRYHELDPASSRISKGSGNDGDWKAFMLYAMGAKPQANRSQCPRTCAIIDRVPNLFQAFFSILDPGKSIPAHSGSYLGYIRYHLGLKVPQRNPPRLRVKDQYHTWQKGEAVLFDDSWEHEVENHSDDIRVVLIVDVLRPMPAVPHGLNWLMTNVLARQVYGRQVLKRLRDLT